MADVDLLPPRGVPYFALVDANGIAIGGTSTTAQLAAKGMRAICQVDPTGLALSDVTSTAALLASRGIRAFAAVDENGVSVDDAVTTADVIRSRGIRPMVAVDANGLSQTGPATIPVIAQRGLSYFCPVDETGTAGSLIPVPPNTIRARTGILILTGDSMTPTAGLSMSAGSGAFTLAGTGIPQVLLWTPANLPNLIAWYKADAGVYSDLGTTAAIDGAAVVQWNDQSPNHYHLVQNDSNPHQPILHKTGWTGGKPALYFDQTPPNGQQMMSGPVAMGSGSPFSAFAVAEMEATTGSNGRVLSYGPPAGPDYSAGGAVLISRSGATAVMGTYRNGPTATIPLAYATNAHIGFVGDGSITTGYVNNSTTGGAPANPDNSTFTTGGNIGVGGQVSSGAMSYASNWQGYIAEVVLTNAALSPADRASLEAYFSARW